MLVSLLASASSSGRDLANASAWAVFLVGAAMILAGAFGVILLRNPVHCALMLVVTLFGVALEFIDQAADFLAAVQIIVYAGAVVIVFLFVIMFLGVDRREPAGPEATKFQRPLALVLGVVALIEILVLSRRSTDSGYSGQPSVAGAAQRPRREHAEAGPVDLHPVPAPVRDDGRPAGDRGGVGGRPVAPPAARAPASYRPPSRST